MLDSTKFAALLKTLYTKGRIDSKMLDHSYFLAAVKKSEQGGKNIEQPIVYGAVQNRATTVAKSYARGDTSKQDSFIMNFAKNFQHAIIDQETILRARKDALSFKRALEHEVDSAMGQLKRDLSLNMYLPKDGAIGKVESVDGNVIQLASVSDVVRFEIGMDLIPDTIAGGGGTEHSLVRVTARNDEKGQITVAAIGTCVAGDFLHVDGDQNAKMDGLSSWLPFGSVRDASLAAAFNNITRSKDPTRLAGVYVDGSSKEIGVALREAKARCALYGLGSPEVVLMNPMDVFILENEVESLATAEKMNVKAGSITLGFDAIRIGGMAGGAKIVSDGACPRGVAFMLKMDTWTYWHMGKSYLNTWNEDGLSVIRRMDDNGLSARMYAFGNIGCSSPGANAVIYLGIRDI